MGYFFMLWNKFLEVDQLKVDSVNKSAKFFQLVEDAARLRYEQEMSKKYKMLDK